MYSAMDSIVVHLMQSGDFDKELRELMDHEGYDISRFREMINIVQTTPRDDLFPILLPITTKAMGSPPPKYRGSHSKSSAPLLTKGCVKVAITPKAFVRKLRPPPMRIAEDPEREQAEKERAEQEQAEHEQAEQRQAKKDQAEQYQAEQEHAEREQAEKERAKQEQAEQERAEEEQAEKDKYANQFGDIIADQYNQIVEAHRLAAEGYQRCKRYWGKRSLDRYKHGFQSGSKTATKIQHQKPSPDSYSNSVSLLFE
jgi:hypothetical protein